MTIRGHKQNIEVSVDTIKKFFSVFIIGGLWILIRSAILQIAKISKIGCTFTNVRIDDLYWDDKDSPRDYMIHNLENGFLIRMDSDQGKFVMCHGAKDGTLRFGGLKQDLQSLADSLNPNQEYFLVACYNQSRQDFYDRVFNIKIKIPVETRREFCHTIGDFTGKNEFTCVAHPVVDRIQEFFSKFR